MREVKKGKKLKLLVFFACLKVLFVLSIAVEEALRGVFNLRRFEIYLAISLGLIPLVLLISLHKKSQCIFMLTIPKMISKRGRMFIVAAAFVLALSGPTKNLIRNGEILSDSINCSQNQLKAALNELADAIKEPYKMIKETFAKILPIIKRNAEKIKNNLLSMKEHLSNVVGNIRKAFSWLASIANMCNTKEASSSPYEQCVKTFENSVAMCSEKLGLFATFCDIAYLAKTFCYTFKSIEYFCELIDFMSDAVLQDIERKMKNFMENVREMFYVSVSMDHKFEFHTNSSKNASEISEDIGREIQDRTRHALKFIDFAKMFLSFYFIFIFIKAMTFHSKYLRSLSYKNRYITREFHQIDERRGELGMDQVMPLTYKERKRYIEMTSVNLVRHEWRHILSAGIFLLFSTVHLCGILAADFSLFWIMSMIRFHGSRGSKFGNESEVEMFAMKITGQGIVAEFCQDLVSVLEPLTKVDNVDFAPCLPKPHFPDFKAYETIILLTLLSWILLFVEPYALRLKNVIMAHYYPERAQDRTVWLYQEILRKRTGFLKYVRRQARHRMFRGDNGLGRRNEMTFMQIFRSKISRWWLLRKLCGENKKMSCLLCGQEENDDNLVRCETPACAGVFCFECFNDLKKSCPMCKCPLDLDYSSSNENMAEDFNSSNEDDEEWQSEK